MSISDDFNFDLGAITSSTTGMDSFFDETPKKASGRKKVASLGDLNGFTRVSEDTLVHRSSQELWSLQKDSSGFFIERLFNADGDPLKE